MSREGVLAAIGEAVTSGNVEPLRKVTATADDLLKLQGTPPRKETGNHVALTRQMSDDVVAAVKKFRQETRATRMERTIAGEYREHAPIENVVAAADQVRDAQIVFATPAGDRPFSVGVLILVDRCWKILYV